MVINVAALDQKIKKLQLIRQLVSDPDVADLLSDPSNATIAGISLGKPYSKKTGVRYHVLKYVAEAADVGNYRTARQITALMEEAKYRFKSQDHATSVRESLRELEKQRLVEKAGTTEEGAALWRKSP